MENRKRTPPSTSNSIHINSEKATSTKVGPESGTQKQTNKKSKY